MPQELHQITFAAAKAKDFACVWVAPETLLDGLFDLDDEAGVDALELYVHRLRKKLEASQARIITLRGVGYLLRVKEE